MKDVKFAGYECTVQLGNYNNNRSSLTLIDKATGDEVAVASVHIPEVRVASDEVLIKDYSENEGMLNALRDAGVVTHTIREVESGFINIPLVKMSDEMMTLKRQRNIEIANDYFKKFEKGISNKDKDKKKNKDIDR